MMSEIQEELEEQLKKAGIEVRIHTKDCVEWVLEHGRNCQGCPHEKGCLVLAQLSMAQTKAKLEQSPEKLPEMVEKILSCQTTEELKKISIF